MEKTGFFLLCFAGLLGFALTDTADEQSVALIVTENVAAYKTVADEIESRLSGKTELYDMKDSRKNDEKILAAVEDQKPSLVIALGDKAAQLAAQKLPSTPVLVGMVLEMDIEELKRPGIEGVALQIPAQSVLTQLRLLLPDLRRVGILSSGLRFSSFREAIRSYAGQLGLQAIDMTVPQEGLLEGQLDRELPDLDALWVLPDPNILSSASFQTMVDKTRQSKKALVVFSENFVKAGALFSISPDYRAIGQQMALLANKMLDKASVRPVQAYLSKFHYPIGSYSVVNTKTADAIGLEISSAQLSFINRVVNAESQD
jgi:ABC-type uncharacterized transport system substrate-binding protein